jgi:DNA polymerase III delta prime subunit
LWPDWLAAGKLHVLAGAPGTGKTTLALAIAAAISCGGRWPDRTPAERGSVVIWSGEDDPADVLIPRLLAMGADTSRAHIVSGVTGPDGRAPYDPARDTELLAAALRGVPDVRLLVLDPIVSAVSGDSHHNAETRRSLQPLVDLAAERRCALLGITHLSKGTAGRDPIERVTGSLAFAALARVVMLAAKQEAEGDRPARRVLMRAKSNIGLDSGGFAYDIRQEALADHPGIIASSVLWSGAVQGSARELMAEAELQPGDEHAQRRSVGDWLRELLEPGPQPVSAIHDAAKESGLAWRTVQRTMERLGVVSKRGGFGQKATWHLPSRATNSPVAPVAPHSEAGATGATDDPEAVRL